MSWWGSIATLEPLARFPLEQEKHYPPLDGQHEPGNQDIYLGYLTTFARQQGGHTKRHCDGVHIS